MHHLTALRPSADRDNRSNPTGDLIVLSRQVVRAPVFVHVKVSRAASFGEPELDLLHLDVKLEHYGKEEVSAVISKSTKAINNWMTEKV